MKLITCERCGKQEMRNTTARFCLDCANARHKELSRQSYHRCHDGIPNLKRCKLCGKSFVAKGKGNQQYCSAECAKAARRARWREYHRRKCAKK